MRDKQEARKILNIYRLFQRDGTLYLNDETDTLDTLFEAVIHAISDCGTLKAKLPYTEFVLPSRKVIEGDSGWVGHFDEKDNRRFFLSDIYDYLYLMYGRH
ncbi:MAG: hypothetical protein OQK45_01915 [Sulfurovum sp.]|nr:hypothetical protein [Sulfurovum sp.]